MKVNYNSTLNISGPQSSQVYETPRSDGGSSPAAGPPANAGDHIDLGSQASLLSLAQAAGTSQNSSDVQRLRALIQSGQYQVDPSALSKSIVSAAVDGD